jgi:hypothetical protein
VALALLYARDRRHATPRARPRDLLTRACRGGTADACTALDVAFPPQVPPRSDAAPTL